MRLSHKSWEDPVVDYKTPVPEEYHYGRAKRTPQIEAPWSKFLKTLKVGAHFEVPYFTAGSIYNTARKLGMEVRKRFQSRRVGKPDQRKTSTYEFWVIKSYDKTANP